MINRLPNVLPLLCVFTLLASLSHANDVKSVLEAETVHRQVIVLDAHADIEIPGKESMYVGDDGRSQIAPDKLRAGGVNAQVMAIAVGPGPRDAKGYAEARLRAQQELETVLALTADASSGVVLATSVDEVMEAVKQGKVAAILAFQNARILGGNVSALDDYYAAGVRVFALTHMGHNDFADSSRPVYIAEQGRHEPEAEHGGLSDLGRQAVKRLNSLGGVIDVSQLSAAATLEVLALSQAPVIATHSNVRKLTDVTRNLSDEEIDEIARGGGVVHVAAFRAYLHDSSDKALDAKIRQARLVAGIEEDYYYPFELYWEIKDPAIKQTFLMAVSEAIGPGSIDQMLDHLDYIVERVGIDHVGIGTDFNHGGGIGGFKDASEALNVTRGLLDRGYTQPEIKKIWGGNFLRVLRQVQLQSASL